ncbi:MAG: TolC family protein [Gammaproteobacteria bacterium]|nr:TolC family protein [Gammaproteobacteria bacterium]
MSQFSFRPVLVAVPLLGAMHGAAAESPLAFAEAVELALAAPDPAVTRLASRSAALDEAAVAAAQLPDPHVSGSLANLPVDSFRLDDAAMTQLKFGLRQEFPPGRTLEIRGQRQRDQAEAARRQMGLEQRRIAREVRERWLDVQAHSRIGAIIARSADAVRRNIDSLSANFATGRMNAQDALRADLELALFEDQAIEHRRQAEVARAGLQRFLGADAARPLPAALPQLPAPPPLAELLAALPTHPLIAVRDAAVAVAGDDVALAEQAYKPAFALEGSYGVRTDYADFASVGVSLSLPLFTSHRQDRGRAAAIHSLGAERLERDLGLRELERELREAYADWQRLAERAQLYRETVRVRARQTADAAITTYASDLTDFAELIRSELAELAVEVKQVELETAQARAWARLEYLRGAAP